MENRHGGGHRINGQVLASFWIFSHLNPVSSFTKHKKRILSFALSLAFLFLEVTPAWALLSVNAFPITQTSVSLSWSSKAGASFYLIGITDKATNVSSFVGSTVAPVTNFVIDNLLPGHAYVIDIVPTDSMSHVIDDTTEITVTTLTSAPPTTPTGLSVTASTSDPASGTLSWSANPTEDGVTSYNIYMNGTLIAQQSPPSTSYTFSGLASGTYTFTVSTVNSNGLSDPSSGVTYTVSSSSNSTNPQPSGSGMSFTLDMTLVYQQFANLFGSLSPLLWPFVGVILALFVFSGVLNALKYYQGK